MQPEFDRRACQRFVERRAADDTELSVFRAIELRQDDLHGSPPERHRRSLSNLNKDDYERVARRGLHQMSRTAMGIVDVSAAKDKAASMLTLSGVRAQQATEASLTRAVDLLYQNRFTVFSTPAKLRTFVEELARIITDGVLKPGHLIRQHDSDKYPYTLVKDLEAAMAQFYVELHTRMAAGESPRTLAPWVEYRVNLSDHFFADGCGKTSQLLAGFVCMRMAHPWPLYRTSKEFYALNGATRRGLDEKADVQTLQRLTAYYQKLFMPDDVLESVHSGQVKDALRLVKQRDFRPKVVTDSGNTYELRRQLIAKGPAGFRLEDAVMSHYAYTYPASDKEELPAGRSKEQSKTLMKAYIADGPNWVPERRRLHELVYTNLRNEAIELHESIAAAQKPDAKPLLLMMRGNSGVGKTYFLSHLVNKELPQLGLPDARDIGSKTINPDVFKEHLRKLIPGEVKWSQSIHSEASMLADRLIAEMRDSKRNFIVDKRLASVPDVEEITEPWRNSAASHRTVMVDIDAPLNVSLRSCASRDDQGSAVRPPQEFIVDGFKAIRQSRRQVAESPLLDAYYAFARVSDAVTVAVASRNEGESHVVPLPGRDRLWSEISSPDPSSDPIETTTEQPRILRRLPRLRMEPR
ncbi:MAG TPA: zeta toxin family protein [Burkholderiaceae bacterium]|nr:zeta toxin family protein [Burkholderiaceae bacterium]